MFWKTTDKMCFLFFLAHYCADKMLWSLTPKLPKCRGWCAVKAVHRIAMSIFTADFLSHNLLLPATADTSNVRMILTWQSSASSTFQEWGTYVWWVKELSSVFIQFYKCCVKKISHQKLILISWSKTNAKLLFKQPKYFRQNSKNWKCLWGLHSI